MGCRCGKNRRSPAATDRSYLPPARSGQPPAQAPVGARTAPARTVTEWYRVDADTGPVWWPDLPSALAFANRQFPITRTSEPPPSAG